MKKMNYLIAALLLCSPIAQANDLEKLLGKLPHPPLPSGHLPMPPQPPMPGALPVPVPPVVVAQPRGDDRYRDERYRDDDERHRHHDHGHHYGQRKHHREDY